MKLKRNWKVMGGLCFESFVFFLFFAGFFLFNTYYMMINLYHVQQDSMRQGCFQVNHRGTL